MYVEREQDNSYKTTRCHNSEYHELKNHCLEDLKSVKIFFTILISNLILPTAHLCHRIMKICWAAYVNISVFKVSSQLHNTFDFTPSEKCSYSQWSDQDIHCWPSDLSQRTPSLKQTQTQQLLFNYTVVSVKINIYKEMVHQSVFIFSGIFNLG